MFLSFGSSTAGEEYVCGASSAQVFLDSYDQPALSVVVNIITLSWTHKDRYCNHILVSFSSLYYWRGGVEAVLLAGSLILLGSE